jgi:molecular chaperone IbpA
MSLKQRGHAMRAFDFAPFYRSTVGFDRLFSMLDQVGGGESAAAPGYPPYNIKHSGENAYKISVAVAGFASADLSIEVKENTLTIRGNKRSSSEEESDLICQGIAERNFERNFQLADHVQIKGASLENGLLQVDLLRVVPEAMKPRAIPITTAKKVVLEAKAAKIAA